MGSGGAGGSATVMGSGGVAIGGAGGRSAVRSRVKEWRITTRVYDFTVRYWVESDSAFGGESRHAARNEVQVAEGGLKKTLGIEPGAEAVAAALLEALPCANSVEVCDARGNGVAVHRDWP